jgi:hypothetical protein
MNFSAPLLLEMKLGCTWVEKGFQPTREEVEKWLAGNYFEEGIKKLIPRFTTCIERNGDYVEK